MINLSINNFKKTFIPFTFLFCFSSAIGVFYSIHNTADSNPKTIWFFLFFGLISFLLLLFLISLELSRLVSNIRKNTAGSKLRSKTVGVFATIAAWFLLSQILDINNLLGCFFILCGVLLSQLLPLMKKGYA